MKVLFCRRRQGESWARASEHDELSPCILAVACADFTPGWTRLYQSRAPCLGAPRRRWDRGRPDLPLAQTTASLRGSQTPSRRDSGVEHLTEPRY
ncbi:hypothetical protein AAFF_G00154190 [Aldrovandia affinis]|uniref:Uncharacterized protein n=1 Tax=Aldrovandia affinis TaxID=143900 RepID=A0AAD7SZT0_9TELE|nr:hypothetical protein AAFF_G00154190 [Aldrovandia affinis]